jgi:purine-binding chemotaxis protein CheW
MQYLTFRMNDVEYAVDVRIIETVVEYSGATPIPSPLSYLRGVFDLRGQVTPLVDLRKKLGLPARADDEGTNVIVFAVPDGGAGDTRLTIGALVDGVSEVLTIADEDIDRSKSDGARLWERYVRGVVRHEGRMIVLLAAEGLFSVEELESIRAA